VHRHTLDTPHEITPQHAHEEWAEVGHNLRPPVCAICGMYELRNQAACLLTQARTHLIPGRDRGVLDSGRDAAIVV
jgi:hypothetical protein